VVSSFQVLAPKFCIHSSLMRYMPNVSKPPWLDHRNNIWWRVDIMKLLIKSFSPVYSSFLPLRSNIMPVLIWITSFHFETYLYVLHVILTYLGITTHDCQKWSEVKWQSELPAQFSVAWTSSVHLCPELPMKFQLIIFVQKTRTSHEPVNLWYGLFPSVNA